MSIKTVEPAVKEVRTVLGEVRPVTRTYGDGSVDCPFCSNPIIFPETECSNPWCDAHPMMTADTLRARRAEIERKAAEAAQRKASHEAAMRRIAEARAAEQAWAAEQIEEAERRGACLVCLFQGFRRVKFVKHRGPCPKKARR